MMNELYLPWVPNIIALGIYFLFGTKFSWKEEIYTCFNVGCVLLGHNFDFLGSYLVVSAHYLMIATGYCSLPSGYCSLLVVTARSHFKCERFLFYFLFRSAIESYYSDCLCSRIYFWFQRITIFWYIRHHPYLFQQQYDTTEILNSSSQKESYSTCNNGNTTPSRFAKI